MPDFWDNPKEAEKLLKSTKQKKIWTDAFEGVSQAIEDLSVLYEFFQAGEGSEEDVEQQYQQAKQLLEELEFKNMLSGEEDQMNCMLQINSGAGGTESQDWAEMLMRMYIMYADKHGLKAQVIEEQAGDGAGIKSCTIEVSGDFAYGFL